jgi:CheY-like chemotaxis protein
MKAGKVKTITMASATWEEDILNLLEGGAPFKLTGIETEEDWTEVREIAGRFSAVIAESASEAYFAPSPTANKPVGPKRIPRDSRASSKAAKEKPSSEIRKQFLVIEDNADDAILIQRAFAATDGCSAFVCRNLSEAKAYLQGAGMYQNRQVFPFPNAVICDMHLGTESGLDFLKWVKASKEFQSMPVVILTGNSTTRECVLAKESGALEILYKPAKYETLRTMLQDMAAKLCG